MILDRYLLKDILKVWSVILIILVMIAVSNKLVRLISKAASGDLSPTLLLQLIGFQLPDLIAFMMPLALFLAILLVISRACVDQEFVAMLSVGVTWQRLVRLCLGISMVIMIFTGFLTLWLVPHLSHLKEKLIQQEESVALLQTLSPGRFYSFKHDELVFYIEDLTDQNHLKEVFIAEQPKSGPTRANQWTVAGAAKGSIITHLDTGHVYVELNDGHRYDGTSGQKDYVSIDFEKYGKLIEKKRPKEGLYDYSSMPTEMLIQGAYQNKSMMAELQWRLSQALSAPILALMALPLGRVGVRQGRFHKLLPALLIFIIYYCLLTLCKRWIDQGVLSGNLGMWWVHIGGGAIALWCLLKASGHLHALRYKLRRRHV